MAVVLLCFYLFFAASYGGRDVTYKEAVAKEKELPAQTWNEPYIRNYIKISKLRKVLKKDKRSL